MKGPNSTPKVASLALASLVAFTVFVTVVPITSQAAPGNVGTEDLDGAGTGTDPFVVTNASELQAMEDDLTANYTLGNDVDANGTTAWNGGSGFVPVGDADTPFHGRFDGAGHVIEGLTIDGGASSDIGMFGVVAENATVGNVSLESVTIEGDTSMGGLVGTNHGTIESISVDGNVGYGTTNVAGGIVGHNDGTVARSVVMADVTADTAGGIVADNDGTVRYAAVNGTVDSSEIAGGLVGVNSGTGTVTKSFVPDAVIGSAYLTMDGEGTLVGRNSGDLIHSYWNADATETTAVGEDMGGVNRSEGLSKSEMTGGEAVANMRIGFYQAWVATESVPIRFSESSVTGAGTSADPYTVANPYQLQAISGDLDASYVLTTDIDATETSQWNGGSGFAPIGFPNDLPFGANRFDGSLNGDGHTIAGLTIDRPDEVDVGLVGRIGDGSVSNVTLLDVSNSGGSGVGSVAGVNDGSIRNVTAHVAVSGDGDANSAPRLPYPSIVGGLVGGNSGTVTNASVSGNVDGNQTVGGIVGENLGTISDTSVDVAVNGSRHVGGIAGSNSHTRYEREDGSIVADSGTINRSMAAGSSNGTSNVGGLVGTNNGTIAASLSNATVTAETVLGGFAGLNRGNLSAIAANGSVSGEIIAGGLVGVNDDYDGNGVSSEISRAVATGAVTTTGDDPTGGLVGVNQAGVSTAYWDEAATTQPNAVGYGRSGPDVRGLTTANMTGLVARERMDGLSVPDTWRLTGSYPALAWQDTEPFVSVSAIDTNSPVTEGERLEITAAVKNWGDTGTRSVNMTDVGFGNHERAATDVSLSPGEANSSAVLTWTTNRGDAGEGRVLVSTVADRDTAAIRIRGSDAGGGGGGGSPVSTDPILEVTETTDDRTMARIEHADEGERLEIDVAAGETEEAVSVRAVAVEATQRIASTEVAIRSADSPADGNPDYTGDDVATLGYIRIETPNDEAALGAGKIRFQVDRNVLDERGLEPESVRLARYHDGAWESLSTLYRGNGEFVGETPGFSTFAVTATLDDEESSEEPPATATPETPANPSSEEGGTTRTSTRTSETTGPGFGAVSGFIAVILAVWIRARS